MSYAKIGFGIALVLFSSLYAWLHWRLPVYNERQVTYMIERHIPIGTDQEHVTTFLNTLKKYDVYYEIGETTIAVYFPETMFCLRGWQCVEVTFKFKDDKMTNYIVKRVSI